MYRKTFLLISHLFLFSFFICSLGHADESKASYWQTQRKGANFFNKVPKEDWFVAAKEAGIQFARLAPDKWQSETRDFLFGDVDSFKQISSADFQTLKDVLDQADRHNIKVVISFLSLPGSRWRQNNNSQDDLRIWQDKKFHTQAALFWKQVANLLKDHPAVVGYNILNEPHPECLSGVTDFREIDFEQWSQTTRGILPPVD